MRNITFICQKNLPAFNIVVGQKFIAEAGTEQANFFAKLTPEYFTKMIADADCWHVGNTIVYTGRAENLTHTSRNRYGRGEKITDAVGRITCINIHKNNPEMCNIRFRTLGGIEYNAENVPVVMEDCANSPKNSETPKIVLAEEYWFIDSKGNIQRALANKDVNADSWRRLTHNYFNTHEEVAKHKDSIIAVNCACIG